MSHQFPPDIEGQIRARMSKGDYASEGDLLRDAFDALDARDEDMAAIKAGLGDMEAGRVEPLDSVADQVRKQHGWPTDA